MGASASHPSCGGGVSHNARGGVVSGRGPHPKHSRAALGQTVSAEDLLSVRGDKKKRRSGLSTLKRKLVGKKKVPYSMQFEQLGFQFEYCLELASS